jgi:hypothetical protein
MHREDKEARTMRRRKLRIRRWLTMAVALGALSFASSASAIPLVDHNGGGTATSAQVYQSQAAAVPDVLERYAAEHPYGSQAAAVPDVLERYAAAHPYGAGLTPAATPSQSSGFDWGDYAIGIGTGVGFILLLVAGLAFGSQHRRRMQPA